MEYQTGLIQLALVTVATVTPGPVVQFIVFLVTLSLAFMKGYAVSVGKART
jgi:hypothetical protein